MRGGKTVAELRSETEPCGGLIVRNRGEIERIVAVLGALGRIHERTGARVITMSPVRLPRECRLRRARRWPVGPAMTRLRLAFVCASVGAEVESVPRAGSAPACRAAPDMRVSSEYHRFRSDTQSDIVIL